MNILRTIQIVSPEFTNRRRLTLSDDQVEIWQADLDALPLAEELLSADERERAARFRFPRDRKRYATCRQLLRLLLSAYLETSPKEVAFCYSAKGKPALDDRYAASEIRFNVSHSDRVALFAFVRGREVGVDVERIKHDFEVQAIAQRFFSEAEQKALANLPDDLKHAAFFHCWTRKEAFVKAKGDGLSLPLEQFDVSVLPQAPALLLGTRPDVKERHHWSLWGVDAGPGFAAALMLEATGLPSIM